MCVLTNIAYWFNDAVACDIETKRALLRLTGNNIFHYLTQNVFI